MNLDKTKIVWFGGSRSSETKYMQHMQFEWNPESFSLLGVKFTPNFICITEQNITQKLDNMKKALEQWSQRDLTVIVIHDLELMFFKFIWQGKPDKLKSAILK